MSISEYRVLQQTCFPNQESELTSFLYSNTSLSLSNASIIASKKSSTVISSTWLSRDLPKPMSSSIARPSALSIVPPTSFKSNPPYTLFMLPIFIGLEIWVNLSATSYNKSKNIITGIPMRELRSIGSTPLP